MLNPSDIFLEKECDQFGIYQMFLFYESSQELPRFYTPTKGGNNNEWDGRLHMTFLLTNIKISLQNIDITNCHYCCCHYHYYCYCDRCCDKYCCISWYHTAQEHNLCLHMYSGINLNLKNFLALLISVRIIDISRLWICGTHKYTHIQNRWRKMKIWKAINFFYAGISNFTCYIQ